MQQPDGSYKVDTTATFSGVMDSEVSVFSIRIQGYTFVADHPNNVQSGKINAEGTLVLKLYYDIQSYTATLVDEDGTQLASWKVPYGAAVTVPADAATPVREGYTFGGWADLGTMPAKDMTYSVADYGSWKANSYTVTFDANGGEGQMDDQTFTYDKAQKLTANSFTKTGYIFAGWSLKADGEVKYADQKQVTNLASSGKVTLYAQWQAGEASYIDGCTITGWYVGESQWNYPFIVEPTLSLDYGYFEAFEEGTELTIAPYWVSDSDVATITFNGNGGEGSMDPLKFNNSSGYRCGLLPRNKFTKEGYVFAGWNTAADGSGETVAMDWFALEGDTTLYAQWKLPGADETE